MATKYLVYNNPHGTEVELVKDTNGKPRVYDDLDLADDCAAGQDNGYVLPLGWDPIAFLNRIIDLDDMSDLEQITTDARNILNEPWK